MGLKVFFFTENRWPVRLIKSSFGVFRGSKKSRPSGSVPASPLSRVPALPLSRFPASPLSRVPAFTRPRTVCTHGLLDHGPGALFALQFRQQLADAAHGTRDPCHVRGRERAERVQPPVALGRGLVHLLVDLLQRAGLRVQFEADRHDHLVQRLQPATGRKTKPRVVYRPPPPAGDPPSARVTCTRRFPPPISPARPSGLCTAGTACSTSPSFRGTNRLVFYLTGPTTGGACFAWGLRRDEGAMKHFFPPRLTQTVFHPPRRTVNDTPSPPPRGLTRRETDGNSQIAAWFSS